MNRRSAFFQLVGVLRDVPALFWGRRAADRRTAANKAHSINLVHGFLQAAGEIATPFDDVFAKQLKQDHVVRDIWPRRIVVAVFRVHGKSIRGVCAHDYSNVTNACWFHCEQLSKPGMWQKNH